MKKLLSFDQASKVTGWAYFEDDQLKQYGKFSLDDQDIGIRLKQFRAKVIDLINIYTPDAVAFEDIQEQGNIATFKVLAEVYGVLSELLTELKISHTSIPAVQWRSILGIKGKARAEQKRNAQQYVLAEFGAKATQDEADAACIGAAYLQSRKCAW